MPTDLLGDPLPEVRDWDAPKVPDSKRQTFSKRKPTRINGYAEAPGSGPDGETCKTCKFATAHQHAKRYWKCILRQRFWTGGAGSDIKLKSPACSRWESKDASSV